MVLLIAYFAACVTPTKHGGELEHLSEAGLTVELLTTARRAAREAEEGLKGASRWGGAEVLLVLGVEPLLLDEAWDGSEAHCLSGDLREGLSRSDAKPHELRKHLGEGGLVGAGGVTDNAPLRQPTRGGGEVPSDAVAFSDLVDAGFDGAIHGGFEEHLSAPDGVLFVDVGEGVSHQVEVGAEEVPEDVPLLLGKGGDEVAAVEVEPLKTVAFLAFEELENVLLGALLGVGGSAAAG